jgi:hypothetical protein
VSNYLSRFLAWLSRLAGNPSPEELEARRNVTGLVRIFCTNTSDFGSSLALVLDKSKLPDSSERVLEVEQALENSRRAYQHHDRKIREVLREFDDLQKRNINLRNWYGDKIDHLESMWHQVARYWLVADEASRTSRRNGESPEAFLRWIAEAEDKLLELIREGAFLTVPDRVDQELTGLKDGAPLDFHENFTHDLPREEDRLQMLRYLREHGLLIRGVVIVERGLIFRAARTTLQRATIALLLLAFALGGGWAVMKGLFTLGNAPGIAIQGLVPLLKKFQGNFAEFYFLYIVTLIGGLLHIGVEALKEARAGEDSHSLLLDDWLLWVHINSKSIIATIGALWVGFAAIVFLLRDQPTIPWETAFLVGYSIDSFVDLFLQRFNALVPVRTQALLRRFS